PGPPVSAPTGFTLPIPPGPPVSAPTGSPWPARRAYGTRPRTLPPTHHTPAYAPRTTILRAHTPTPPHTQPIWSGALSRAWCGARPGCAVGGRRVLGGWPVLGSVAFATRGQADMRGVGTGGRWFGWSRGGLSGIERGPSGSDLLVAVSRVAPRA